MSQAIRSQGTLFKRANGVGVFTELEEASDIKLAGISVSSIDVTHLASTSKEFIAGLRDNGTCEITCNFTNGTVQALMRADMNTGVTSTYQVIILGPASSTTTFEFDGFLTKYDGPQAKVDGKLEIQITIKITGDLSITTV